MATTREAVLDRARQWATDQRLLRWNRVANNCFEGDSLFLWATRPAERGSPPPAAGQNTGINCFEIFMLVMCHVDDRPITERQDMIKAMMFEAATLSGRGPNEPDAWPGLLTGNRTLTRFRPGFRPLRKVPAPGQLVFLNESSHVVMANGVREGRGRIDASRVEVLSFFGGYPAVPANTSTPSPLAVATLAEIRDYFTALKILELENHGKPPVPPDIDIVYGDPFWA